MLKTFVWVASVLLAANIGYAAPETETGLVYRLTFDGTFEPAVGKAIGAVRAEGNPQFVEGRFGQAVALTNGAYLVAPVPPAIKKGDYSISFWIKPTWHPADKLPHAILEIPDDPGKADKIGWAPGQYLLSKGWSETIAPNQLYGIDWETSDYALRCLRPSQWAHFLIEYSVSNGFSASYVNGQGTRTVMPNPKPPVAYGNSIWMGARAGNPAWGGYGEFVLDDLKIYDRIVAPAEIAAVAGTNFPPPNNDLLTAGTTFDIAKAVETPHTTWAKPLSGGALKLLCIVEGFRSREIAELAQRIELAPVVLTTPGMDQRLVGVNPEIFAALGRQVETALKAGDVRCILVGAFGWNLLPESTRAAIMDAVKAGAGLVFCDPHCISTKPGAGIVQNVGSGIWSGWADTPEGAAIEKLVGRLDRPDEDYLAKSIPWRNVSLFDATLKQRSPESLFRGGRVGKGRILIYDIYCRDFYPGCLTPHNMFIVPFVFDGLDYDYAVGAAAKAVLWAAGRDPAVRVGNVVFQNTVHPNDPQIYVGLAGAWMIDLVNSGTTDVGVVVTLTARTHDPDPAYEARQAVALKPGATRIAVPQTIAASGVTYGDVRVLVDGKVTDWSTATVEINSVYPNPRLLDCTADRPFYGDSETPRITARFAVTRFAYVTGGVAEIRWRLYDSYDRQVARGSNVCALKNSDEDTNESSWTLAPLADSSLGYRLIMDLVYNGNAADRRAIDLWRMRDTIDDFLFVSWAGGGSPVGRLATLVMRDRHRLDYCGAGCVTRDLEETFTQGLEWVAKNNLRPWIYATHIGGAGSGPDGRRILDLADPHWKATQRQRLADIAKTARGFSPLFYSLGDETSLGDPAYRASNYEQDAFRKMLETRYATIEKLNAAWATQYTNWAQIVIPAPEASEWKTGAPVLNAVADFRETLYADALKLGTEGSRSNDPTARTGVEGIFGLGNAWTGQDYWKMALRSTFLGQYIVGMEMNMIRSFQKPGDLLGAWYNYTMLDREYSLYGPWQILMRGGRAFMWFDTLGGGYSALNPDFSTYKQFEWTNEELQPLLAGIGKLVVGLKRDDLGVAILYQQRNLSRDTAGFHCGIVAANLLEDLGIQHDWIHGDQIKTGALAARKVKVLFLPWQNTMDPEVAAAIRAYVEAGGAVVADVLPAQYDEIKCYAKPPLNDLFAGGETLKGAMPPASEDDVKAWASHVKSVGKGKTLYYGGMPTTYNRDRMNSRGQYMRSAVGNFLTACGVKPSATIQPVDGGFLPRIVVTYHDGASLYAAAQREYCVPDMASREFEFAAPAKAHVYDVRAGKYLGETDKVKVAIEPARGALVAFLPYKAKAVEIQGLNPTVKAGDTLKLRLALVAEGGALEHGVFRVEVLNPAGQRIPPLCSKTRWTGGLADIPLTIAYNDPAGKWTIRVTDIATGTAVESSFTVVPN